MVSRKIFVETVINNSKNGGFDFSHISQMNNTIISNKMDMTYDFYTKQNIHMIEWKLNKFFKKVKNLMNKFPQNWMHPLNRKFASYRV